MKYLLLIYHNPGARQVWEAFPEAQRAEDLAACAALNEELAGHCCIWPEGAAGG